MEDLQPIPAIIKKTDGYLIIPNPQRMNLVHLAIFTKMIIETGDTVVLVDSEGRTRTLDLGVLREESLDRINQLCMTYAKAMHKSREVFSIPTNP